MRLAFAIKGDKRPMSDNAVIWGDPESRVMSEITDAVGKQVQILGVPQRVAWEKVGYTQTEIDRMEAIKQQERLEGALIATPTLPTTLPQPTPANPQRGSSAVTASLANSSNNRPSGA
jgi:hypothetical protein